MNVRGFSQAATDLKVHLLCLYATEQNKVWKSTNRKVTLEITGNIRILLLWKSTKLNHFNSAHSDQSSFQPVYRLPYTHSRMHVTSVPNWILGKNHRKYWAWSYCIFEIKKVFSTVIVFQQSFYIFWIYVSKDMYCKCSVHVLICTMYLLGM